MIKKYFMDLKLRNKIVLYYFVLVLLLAFSTGIIYEQISNFIISKELGDSSIQILDSINSNIMGVVENANTCSKLILSNTEVRSVLSKDTDINKFEAQIKINIATEYTMQSFDSVDEIFIFDNNNNIFTVGNSFINNLQFDDIKKVSWYNDYIERNGGYILLLNGNGDIKRTTKTKNFISHVRVINDLITQKNIGTLIVNIPEEQILRSFDKTISNYYTTVFLKDLNGDIFMCSDDSKIDILDKYVERLSENHFEIIEDNNDKYIIASLFAEELQCYIYSLTPYKSLNDQSIFTMTMLILIAFYSFFVIVGSVIISKTITLPINDLLKSMEKVKDNVFEYSDIVRGHDEIGRLKEGYNLMIEDIQKLIKTISKNEEIKRKAELEVLQAQIKPHFLYNTIDMICSLALLGKNDDVYSIMKALGGFYRTSLNNGKEIITIKEEMQTVKNYFKIQQERYLDMFVWEVDMEKEVEDVEILKLVLQPLVENSIYHGIRSKGKNGQITVSAKHENDRIRIVVVDNGIGMSEELITEILQGNTKDKLSIGLRGTIERLRIMYGHQDIVKIESVIGEYTKIIIDLPKSIGYYKEGVVMVSHEQ